MIATAATIAQFIRERMAEDDRDYKALAAEWGSTYNPAEPDAGYLEVEAVIEQLVAWLVRLPDQVGLDPLVIIARQWQQHAEFQTEWLALQ